MATRIAHISDLHFSAKSLEQVTALERSICEMAPDMVVISGDLTRSGKKEEFQQARAFVDLLRVPTMVLPGNHDIPMPGLWARLKAPSQRFESYFSDMPAFLETSDLLVVGLNTAVGWQPGFDWSLGYLVPSRVEAAAAMLAAQDGKKLRIVVCHHPLHPHPLDPGRSRTFGGPKAFDRLCSAGMDLLLHGHLHRTDSRYFAAPQGGQVCEVCANTALANRQRGGPAGYNIIDVQDRRWHLSVIAWHNELYQSFEVGKAPTI